GKLIEQHEITNQNTFVINKEDKANGVYFLKVETLSKIFYFKIVIK
ncbi:MAG: hypothetical protein CMP72_02045, partial [Flavobacteriales bacterium]|nr:hypothetical protein [Flavobacteriales bacterium]